MKGASGGSGPGQGPGWRARSRSGGLPQEANAEGREFVVRGHEGEVLEGGLGGEEAIKRIAMRRGEKSGLQGVGEPDREGLPVFLRHQRGQFGEKGGGQQCGMPALF